MLMHLQRLKLHNFRLLEDFDLQLISDITLLIGPNNSGKSSVVDALLLLKRGIQDRLRPAFDERLGFERIVSRHNSDGQVTIEVSLANVKESLVSYSVRFSRGGIIHEDGQAGSFRMTGTLEQHQIVYRQGNGVNMTGVEGTELALMFPPYGQFEEARRFFRNMVHIDPFRKVSFQSAIGAKLMVHPTGEDLAQVLHQYYVSEREKFDGFESSVQRVIPELQMIETPLVGSLVTISLKFLRDSMKYNLWQISSGLKDVLVLLTAIHFSDPNSLIILEEPENHLHPAAQKALCAIISEAASKENKQFLITTHSEFVMNQFDREKVFFMNKQDSISIPVPLAKADLLSAWDRVSDERGTILPILTRNAQVIVIVEGRNDYKTLEPLWSAFDIRDKVLPARSEGGGWKEIVDYARQLRECLKRFRLPSIVFVLLDNDNERKAKLDYLKSQGFDDHTCHVWERKEIESYLFLPKALSVLSTKPVDQVKAVIQEKGGRDKETLKTVLSTLNIPDTPHGLIITHALQSNPNEVPSEFNEVLNKIQKCVK